MFILRYRALPLVFFVLGVSPLTGQEISPTTTDPAPVIRSSPSPNGGGVAVCQRRLEAAKGQPVDLLFIGDSITQHFQDQPTEKWPLVGGPVWDEVFAPRHALDFGVASDRIEHALWRLEHLPVQDLHPKVVIIMLGMNNANDPTDLILAKLDAVRAKVMAMYPDAARVVMSISANRRMADKTLAVNTALKERAATAGYTYVDLYGAMTASGPKAWKGLGYDNVHLSQEGYRLWADLLVPVVDALVKGK